MNKYIAFLLLIFSSASSFANGVNESVKLSKSGICHDNSSSSYNRTKNFTPYESLEACLKAGGRLPKSYSSNFEDVAANSPVATYKRSYFGAGWADDDRDCQNTRAEVLINQNTGNLRFADKDKCRVISGKWTSIFTGKSYYNASDLDIDHIFALSLAWQHGADTWDTATRHAFANDPVNLIAVEASLNRSKGDKSITEFLPPANQCAYILRFLRISKSYPLKFTQLEETQFAQLRKQYCGK